MPGGGIATKKMAICQRWIQTLAAVGARLLMPMAIIHFAQFGRDPILGRMAVMIGGLHIFTLAASAWDGRSV